MEKAKKNQNVVSEVKEEVEMLNEEVKAQENVVANEEEKEMMNEEVKQEIEMVKRFCVECGTVMMVPKNSRVTICDSCREAKKKATAERAHMLAQKRKAELGLVTMNVSLYESTKNILKAKSKEKGMSIADFLKELLEEPAKQETDIA